MRSEEPLLIHVASRTQWSLLGRLAQRLAAAGEHLCISHEGPDPRLQAPAPDGVELFDFDALAESSPGADTVPWFERAVPRRHERRWLGAPRYRSFLTLHRSRLKAARRLVARVRPRLLIVPEDGVSGNAWLIKAAEDARVPVLVCPYEVSSSRDFDNALAQKRRAGELILASDEDGARVLATCPQWARATEAGPALLFPADYILARERLGLTLRDPWTVHGGSAERIAVESETMRRHYLREGLPEAKLSLTGTVYCDVGHDAMAADPRHRQAWDDASKIEPGRTRVLVSLPPSYHAARRAESEFESFGLLCAKTLGFLTGLPGVDVTVSIHPATLAEDRAHVERSGATVSDGYVIKLIARPDLFMTCVSSTIRWAVACRKPAVNYDLYKSRLEDYVDAPGVFTMETLGEFEAVMRRLTDGDDRYRAVAGAQARVSEEWGVIDGRNFERIHALARQLTERRG